MVGYQQGKIALTPQLLCKRRGGREERRERKGAENTFHLKQHFHKRHLIEEANYEL